MAPKARLVLGEALTITRGVALTITRGVALTVKRLFPLLRLLTVGYIARTAPKPKPSNSNAGARATGANRTQEWDAFLAWALLPGLFRALATMGARVTLWHGSCLVTRISSKRLYRGPSGGPWGPWQLELGAR